MYINTSVNIIDKININVINIRNKAVPNALKKLSFIIQLLLL